MNLHKTVHSHLTLANLTAGDNTVTIYVDDAAGNKAEYEYTVVAEKAPVFALTVSPKDLSLKVGDSEQLKVTVTQKVEEGTETDVEDSGTVEEGTETDDNGIAEESTETEADDTGTLKKAQKQMKMTTVSLKKVRK